MNEMLVAGLMLAEARDAGVAGYYRREWRQFRRLDKLEQKLKLQRNRLGLLGQPIALPDALALP